MELGGPLKCEALGRLPTLPKVKAGSGLLNPMDKVNKAQCTSVCNEQVAKLIHRLLSGFSKDHKGRQSFFHFTLLRSY